jgi:hypothetical protein
MTHSKELKVKSKKLKGRVKNSRLKIVSRLKELTAKYAKDALSTQRKNIS